MSWGLIWQAFKNRDMRVRIMWVLFAIFIFRALAFIPVPIAEPTQLHQLLDTLFKNQQLLGFLDLLSGGALSQFSIVLLGLGPYINASIIMQLLTHAIPKLEELNKEGEMGRRKIGQYTRMIGLPLAIVQSIGFILLIRQQASQISGIDLTAGASIGQWVLMVATLTGGAMLLMWIGELISEQGVGNGISLLIFAGIVSRLPGIISTLISTVTNDQTPLTLFGQWTLPISGPGTILLLLVIFVATLATYAVVKLNEAQRPITISYAKRVRGNRAYGGVNTTLPVKLITAGVIPIIFAVALLSVPYFVGQLISSSGTPWMADLGSNLLIWFNPQGLANSTSTTAASFIYPGAYFALVMMFTYFYTGIIFNAKEIAENLQKQGGFIGGIRPGPQTELYLKKVVNRLTLFGSTALGLLAVMPFIIDALVIKIYGTPISNQLTIGGTGLLITVSVALETLRQIESRALMVTYDSDKSPFLR